MTNGQGSNWTRGVNDVSAQRAKLSGLLDEQKGVLERLWTLCSRQSAMIEDDELDDLLGLLAERQTIIDELGQITDRVASLRKGLPPDHIGPEVAKKVEAVSGLAARIAEVDRRDGADLMKRRDALSSAMMGMERSRQARAAYGPGSKGSTPKFQDRKG